MSSAYTKFEANIDQSNSLLCVGLDPVLTLLPAAIQKVKDPFFAFNKAIIDATHDLVCTFKFNAAFYEARGAAGVAELKMSCDYVRKTYPHIPYFIDAKRNDIGNSNEAYIQYVFEYLQAEGVTVQPYMGGVALRPFLDRKDKVIIILCRTSNEGAGEFQDLPINGKPLYEVVTQHVVDKWNTNKNCMVVVGATYPQELARVRKIVGDMIMLVPGVGTQGGTVKDTLQAGLNSQKKGLLINASRGVIFASRDADFAEAARSAALKLRDEINSYR